ncbi:MAG: hypothetical protein DHS20C04_26400 [Hyphococcus sp.]|nr:MAG: hypothetical protein DHS20C04_26400 [Marinicaulis sp.]
MTLDRLLDAHAQARGGKAALESINSVDVTLEIVEPDFSLTGHYRASRDGMMRIDVYAGDDRVFTEALGPDGGWQMFGDGKVADLSPDGDDALRRGVIGNLYGLHELPSLGYELKLIGSNERNGGSFWEIEKTAPDGFSEHLFFDKDTFLIASSVNTSALHPDIDSTEVRQETFYFDYQKVGGVLFSNRSEKRNLDTGDVMQTSAITSRRINVALDPAQFERPPAE